MLAHLKHSGAFPLERGCTSQVRLANAVAEVGPYAWDAARSMHFGACWHAYADVRSRTADKHEPWDFDYAELKGRGLFVGTTMSLWQEITDWWGEGDEKVFVDGEKTPSYVGTGSEDHFGYAWGSANIFSHPFLSQPVGITTGRALRADTCRRTVVNIRNRALDAIPFTTSCRFLMEMWHWKDVKIDFAPLACYYLRPGGTSNHGLDVEAAKRPPAWIRTCSGNSRCRRAPFSSPTSKAAPTARGARRAIASVTVRPEARFQSRTLLMAITLAA